MADELSKKLRLIKDKNVAIDAAQTENNRMIVKVIVDHLIHEMGQFIHRAEYVGSAYEKTQAGEADDYDVMMMININVPQWRWTVEHSQIPSYRILRRVESGSSSTVQAAEIRKLVDSEGRLAATEVRRVFQSEVDRILSKDQCTFHARTSNGQGIAARARRSQGERAATTLTVEYGQSVSFTIDLVPTISAIHLSNSSGVDYMAKPVDAASPDGSANAHLWKISTSLQEKNHLSSIDQGNLNHRLILKIYKLLHRTIPQLSMLPSFFYKNVMLYLAEKNLSWQDKDLGERFMDMAREIMSVLQRRTLKVYFNREEELLKDATPISLENVTGFLQRILNKGISGFIELVNQLN